MPAFCIRASFPMGTFLGHRDVGHPAALPDTARLQAALLHAAATGTTSAVVGGESVPSPDSLAALHWLEEHPPANLALPRSRRVSRSSALSWRSEGVLGKKGIKKSLRNQSDAVALDGPIAWLWPEGAPREVVGVLDALCADVSCLGEADSPVVLDLVHVEPTHELDQSETAFPQPGGETMRTPGAGRTSALSLAHAASRPAKRPTVADDRHKTDEAPRPSAVASGSVRDRVYRSLQPVSAPTPWDQVVLLHLDTVPKIERVKLAVATHRALISRLGEAPALITGSYPDGVQPPANRLAIQYLDASLVRHKGLTGPAIALMMPAEADAAELAALHRSVKALRRIYTGADCEVKVVEQTAHDTAGFWWAAPEGSVRLWRPLPSLVPETRRQRSAQQEPRWTLQDAALLSIGYVFRDQLAPEERISRPAIVQAARARGVRVHEVHALPESRPDRHAHKVPEGQIVFPYTALLDLGELAGDRALLAAGQSRHLGGGLLVPEDIVTPVAVARGFAR